MTVGEAAAFDPARGCVGTLDVIAQLRQQPAFADARLAKDRRDTALSSFRDREEIGEAFSLGFPPDHRRVDAAPAASGRALFESSNLVRLNRIGLSLQIESAHVDRIDEC